MNPQTTYGGKTLQQIHDMPRAEMFKHLRAHAHPDYGRSPDEGIVEDNHTLHQQPLEGMEVREYPCAEYKEKYGARDKSFLKCHYGID